VNEPCLGLLKVVLSSERTFEWLAHVELIGRKYFHGYVRGKRQVVYASSELLLQFSELGIRTRSYMENTMRRWFIACHRKLSDDGSFCAWKGSYTPLASNLLEAHSNQPSMTATLYPNLIQVRWQTRIGCCNVCQPGHYQGIPAYMRQYSRR
jgi:hypothetical protein